jgi:UDP-N-acetylglucosamine--N-acetylmuramyl-(pentapeptide) pyrophosphoryl-undecaprenol N-acetylglucosamine transferase
MKILFTGGGTGGHFYPIIAVADEVNNLVKEHKIVDMELYFMSPSPYNSGQLFNSKLIYKKNYAGKLRRYFSILNFFDLFKTLWGVIKSTWDIYLIYPDVVFGKGGYASFPAIFAARILRIPVVIHESDSVPGRVNLWAGKFAQRVALSYPDAAKYFKKETIALTGNPIRKDLDVALTSNAHEFLHLDPTIPTIFIIGGSLGSQMINEIVTEALPRLLNDYQVIHQTGKRNISEVQQIVAAVLLNNPHKSRYHPFDYMDNLTMRSAAGAAKIIVSRAGSTIFEIASWELPSIIIPIDESISHDQSKNAFAYARTGAAVVIEEPNLTSNILIAEINRITNDEALYSAMKEATKKSVHPQAAKLIAEELLKICLSHAV